MDRQILKYMAVKASSTEQLTEWVNDIIKEGYQPFGGMASAPVFSDIETGKPTNLIMFSQAMVKYI